MNRLIAILLALITSLFAACGSPPQEEAPGDSQAATWEMPALECPEDAPVIDCEGGVHEGDLKIRESCTTVRDCIVHGNVRVYGEWSNMDQVPQDLTCRADWVERARLKGLHSVTLERVEIHARGRASALYLGVGSVGFRMIDSSVNGGGTAQIYLGAESTRTELVRIEVDDAGGSREAVAIDASDRGVLKDSTIRGGVRLYRNCGQRGRTRHTTPSHWRIEGNEISEGIHLSAHDGEIELYCLLDNRCPWGSGVSDYDHSRYNAVVGNDARVKEGPSARHNEILP